jgi:hypothetical protein
VNTEADHTRHRLQRAVKAMDESMYDVDQSWLKVKNARKLLEAEDADDLVALIGPLERLRDEYRAELAVVQHQITEAMNLL